MVIELLKVKVAPEHIEQFIQKDAEIWTEAIAHYPGFLAKEVWINPNELSEVILVIRWATREQWKSIPFEQLQEIEARFSQQIGNTYKLIESSEYQVHNPQSQSLLV